MRENLKKARKAAGLTQQAMADKLNSGDAFFTPSVYWPAGFRKSWEAPLQQLILSGDIDTFIKDTDAICVEYFANLE